MKLNLTNPLIPGLSLGISIAGAFLAVLINNEMWSNILGITSAVFAFSLTFIYFPLITVKLFQGKIENKDRVVNSIGIFGTSFILIGMLMKLGSMPGANIIIILGCLLCCLNYLPTWYASKYGNADHVQRILYFVFCTSLGILIAASQFKIQHWPGANFPSGKFFIAAADSTGHGVPGAMVSVVCSNALNRTIKEFGVNETGKILDKTRELVLETFEKSTSEVKDGMDISLLSIDITNQKICWSGANNPLWYIENQELKEIIADKQPIGKTENQKPLTSHEITFQKGSTFYLFTDGLADQFGGPKGKKFKYKQFSDLLLSICNKPMHEQLAVIDAAFENWKSTLEQVDDVCVIGIRI